MPAMRSRRRSRHSPAEYFVAFIGLALIVFVVALVATSGSCQFGISPEVGVRPSQPRPTPTATP